MGCSKTNAILLQPWNCRVYKVVFFHICRQSAKVNRLASEDDEARDFGSWVTVFVMGTLGFRSGKESGGISFHGFEHLDNWGGNAFCLDGGNGYVPLACVHPRGSNYRISDPHFRIRSSLHVAPTGSNRN